MTALAPGYDPTQFEARLYAQWERSGVFAPSGTGEPYCILLPPPNVTGTLHMGHAFQHTLQDALVRYHRMRGFDTLWQMGTDHAGIATEMVVSRNLKLEGNDETRDSLGRHRIHREHAARPVARRADAAHLPLDRVAGLGAQ